jgi:Tfp pilus assembly protein PilF
MRILATKSKPDVMQAAIPAMARFHFPAWLLAVLLALATIALYWPAMRSDFINYDDPDYVTANSHVQDGLTWAAVKWAFTNTEQGTQSAPLMWLSHELGCQLFGLNPWGHHLINLLLHAANTALVFLVFRRMTGATWRSLMLAALFGWHPLRVESVAWVTERKDVLSGLFWMLTLLAYAKYVEAGRIRDPKLKVWYGTALGMFVFGLMSKPMVVTLPCVLLLLDYWPLKRISEFRFPNSDLKRLLVEKIPFFALAAGMSIVTFLVQKQGGTVATIENLPLGARVGNALISYCRYLEKMFWPMDLAVFYPHPGHWPPEKMLLAAVFLCGLSALLFMKRGSHPFLLVGWLWYCGTLVPVIGLVQVGEQSMADRYTYIPSLGVLIPVIWGAYEFSRRWRFHEVVLSAVGLAAMVLCFAMTRQQLGYWKDSETLFRHALTVTQNNYVAHNNLGSALDKKGQTGEAIRQFQAAILLKPDDADAYYNLGNALLRQGQTDEAVRQFQAAIRLKPDDADVHMNLGVALFSQGQTDAAISQFKTVIRFKPDFVAAHINLGNALLHQGQTDEAISEYQAAVRLKPDDAAAQRNLAKALELKSKSPVRPPGLIQP